MTKDYSEEIKSLNAKSDAMNVAREAAYKKYNELSQLANAEMIIIEEAIRESNVISVAIRQLLQLQEWHDEEQCKKEQEVKWQPFVLSSLPEKK